MDEQIILCNLALEDGSYLAIGNQFCDYLPRIGEHIEYEKMIFKVTSIRYLISPDLTGHSSILIRAEKE